MNTRLFALIILVSYFLTGCAAAAVIPMAAPAAPAVGVGVAEAVAVSAGTGAIAVGVSAAQTEFEAQCNKLGGEVQIVPDPHIVGQMGKICAPKQWKVADESRIPRVSPDHHDEHTPIEGHTDAVNRANKARDTFGKWGEESWEEKPTQPGQVRCIVTTISDEIVRVGIYITYKITATNAFGDFSLYDPLNRGWITSFTEAKWEKDALRPATDLRNAYGGAVQNQSVDCNVLSSMGMVPPAIGHIAP